MAESGILDFLTVSTEYCAFVEQIEKLSKRDFVTTAPKLLSFLYVKASLLQCETDVEGYCEQYVTEDDYNFIQSSIAEKLGELDSFLIINEPDNYDSSEELSIRNSECFADIYQDVRDFIERYRSGNEEAQELALFECILNFKLYWGPRLLALLQELHSLSFTASVDLDEEEK